MFSTPIVLKYKPSNKTYYVDPGIFASKKHYNMFLKGTQTCLQFQGAPSL